jgi:hypothetical protein
MSPRRRPIEEGDPILPQPSFETTGLHERDVYIASAVSAATRSWEMHGDGRFVLSADEIADRACAIADAVMERKERAS